MIECTVPDFAEPEHHRIVKRRKWVEELSNRKIVPWLR